MHLGIRRRLTSIPSFFPDQTLYSWVGEYHFHSGNALPEITAEQLFWSKLAGWNFHIPSHLDNFCASTRRSFGDPEDIVSNHTVLPAYLWFRPNSIAATTILRMRGKTTAGLPQLLGLKKTQGDFLAPRHHCAECTLEDTRRYGRPYWHLSHQLPGVAVCLVHQAPLLQSNIEEHRKARGRFLGPADIPSQHSTALAFATETAIDRLLEIAKIAFKLHEEHQTLCHLLPKVHALIIQRLCALGLRIEMDPISSNKVASQEFESHACALRSPTSRYQELPEKSALLGLLLLKIRHPIPAFEYAQVIQWLFEDWEHFRDLLSGATDCR